MPYRKSVLLLPFITLLILFATTPTATAETQWQVKIDYSNSWSGAVGGINSASYDGYGDRTINVNGDIVSAVIQKQDSGGGRLCVELWTGGGLEERSCTTASYGVVTVGASHYSGSGFFSFTMIFIIVFGLIMYIASHRYSQTISKNPQSNQKIRTYASTLNTPPPLTDSSPDVFSVVPPPHTKPSFRLDGYDWLDYNGKKWRRPHQSKGNWELYIEDSKPKKIPRKGTKKGPPPPPPPPPPKAKKAPPPPKKRPPSENTPWWDNSGSYP